MSTMIFPAPKGDAFSAYKPSKNAHVEILTSTSKGKGLDKDSEGGKSIRLSFKQPVETPTSKDLLSALSSSINPILGGNSTSRSFQYLSSACYKLVTPPHSLGPTIYSTLKDDIHASLTSLAREWRGSIMSRESGWLLRLTSGWTTFFNRIDLLSAVFVYLDRIYSNPANGISSIREMAIAEFKKTIWENAIIQEKTREEFLAWVSNERSSEMVNMELRPTIIHLTKLSKLLTAFHTLENPYRDSTRDYYVVKAVEHIESVEGGSMSPSKYVEWVLEKADEELQRGKVCLSDLDGEVAQKTVRVEAGEKMSKRIVRRALDEAMDTADRDALGRLYQFSVDADIFPEFASCLEQHINNRLSTLISDPANDPQMIETTLKIKRFADQSIVHLFSSSPESTRHPTTSHHTKRRLTDHSIEECTLKEDPHKELRIAAKDLQTLQVKRSLLVHPAYPATNTYPIEEMEEENGEDDEDETQGPQETPAVSLPPLSAVDRIRQLELEDSVRNGFKSGMGSRQNAPAEWIAKHLDAVMRKGQGSGTEAEFNALLDEIIALIGFTKDKDVFKAFYSTQLAKRLLLNKSASDDMERNMIIKLQREMGEEFTSGDVMMKDLQLSETMAKTYQTTLAKSVTASDPTGLSANVLTESAWPAYPLLKDGWDFHLPSELQHSIDAFNEWYAVQHKNRQLSWRWQLATVTISARFPSGKYEIGVSLFQAVVMMAFNDDDALDFNEIKKCTGIESSELVRTLQSLSLGRKGTRVLAKRPAGKEVNPTDVFSYNKSFTSDRIKFRINQIQQDMSAEESRKTNEQVAIDRVSVLEATIVRIMKGKKKMTLQLLIDAVVTDVNKRFPPDVKEIKKRVESLIEREFLMRDENDRNLLHYLA